MSTFDVATNGGRLGSSAPETRNLATSDRSCDLLELGCIADLARVKETKG